MTTKSIDLTCDQIDSILIDELQYALEINIGYEDEMDIPLITSLLRVLKYYMIDNDYNEYWERLKLDELFNKN